MSPKASLNAHFKAPGARWTWPAWPASLPSRSATTSRPGFCRWVPRTAAGYRRYDARHERALLAYRALVRGFGGEASQAIMRAVHAGDLPGALTLIDAGHAALHEQRRSLRVAGEALEAVAEQPPDALAVPRAGMRIGEAGFSLGVRPSALRVWEAAGLAGPGP